ncbi:MAG: hypothetical protein HOP24_07335 [Sideroxydans sp.]|nr:hypothetical protein [Sideroxydans sp.]
MSIKKWVAMAGVVLGLASASTYAEEAALERIAPMDGGVTPSIALILGKPLSLAACAGACSTQPGFDVDIRWMKRSWFDYSENSFELHTSAGVRYASYAMTVNGSANQLDSEAVNVGFHMRHRALPRLELSVRADVFGMATLRSDNAPRQIDFANMVDAGLSYDVTPAFQISLGLSSRLIPTASSNTMNLNAANLGFVWTPNRK